LVELPAKAYKDRAPTELRAKRLVSRVCQQYPKQPRSKGSVGLKPQLIGT
jgi:hypothetical protein